MNPMHEAGAAMGGMLESLELESGTPLLAGVSGGADSMVMLHVLAACGVGQVIACHLDHGLRGGESRADAELVEATAGVLDIEMEIGRTRVAALAKRGNQSIETTGRIARRKFFARCAAKYHAAHLFLAHHADDQAETVIWNLCRGSGLRGLGGMAPDSIQDVGGRPLRILRPFLGLRKSTLIEAARQAGITWREDASNQSADFTRNRIRNDALPALADATTRDPVPALVRFAAQAREDEELLGAAAEDVFHEAYDPEDGLAIRVLLDAPAPLSRRAIAGWLRESGAVMPGSFEIEGVLAVARAAPGGSPRAINLPGNARVARRRGRLVFVPNDPENQSHTPAPAS